MYEIDPMWAGVGSVIAAIGTFIAGQRHGKSEFITAVSKASDIVIQRLQTECDRIEASRERYEMAHADCERRVTDLQGQVWKLMHGDIAEYRPSDLRRVGED